jgi:arylsulfatase A-like enzyme
MCTALDRCLGRLLKTLDEERLAADTIVVFTSDHGEMLGSHGLGNANEPYEESVRIPLLVRYPGVLKAGSRSDLLISTVDFFPTLAALCGAEIPEAVQGRNLARYWTGAGGTGSDRPESIFAEGKIGATGEWRMIVRGFDKLVTGPDGEVTHLFNLADDPFETDNQAGSTAMRRRKDELSAQMSEWRKRTHDGRSASGLRRR